MNFSQQKLDTALNSVPESLKDALFSERTSQEMEKILNRYDAEDKAMSVSSVIGYTLAGLIPVKKFIIELENTAGLDATTAKNIAHDVRSQILAPVAQELAVLQPEAEKHYAEAITPKLKDNSNILPDKEPVLSSEQKNLSEEKPFTAPEKKEEKEIKPLAEPPKKPVPPPTPSPQTKLEPTTTPPTEPTPGSSPAPQIEYLKYTGPSSAPLNKPDESVAREHPGIPAEAPKNNLSSTPLAPPAPEMPKHIESDEDLKNEIFPPPPGVQETKTPPPPNLPGASVEKNEEKEREFPPIPDSHKVNLKNPQ